MSSKCEVLNLLAIKIEWNVSMSLKISHLKGFG